MSVQVEDGVAYLQGDLTLGRVTEVLAQGRAAIDAGARVLDLSRVGQLDSAALSLLLSLHRHAASRGASLQLRRLPDRLLGLARLYGVAEFMQPAA